MILADSINLPLVAVMGIVVFAPLTLLVTTIESLVFRWHLRTGFRVVFGGVLVANVLSTLAGGLVLAVQDVFVHQTGIRESIPAFVRGYHWVCPLLIAIYFLKSVLIEGLWLTRRRFVDRIGRPRVSAWRAVLLGNVLSYLVVGPLFYMTTRPHFGGLETTFDVSWTANPGLVVYYIDRKDGYVKRTRLGGGSTSTLIPYPAWSFLVSEDESTFAFVGTDRSLYVYRPNSTEPILVRKYEHGCFMTLVSLSPDNRRLAYLDPPEGKDRPYERGARETLSVFDLETHKATALGTLPASSWDYPLAWSTDGNSVYVRRFETASASQPGGKRSQQTVTYVFSAEPPFGLKDKLTTPPAAADLVVNYARAQGSQAYSGGRAVIRPHHRLKTGPYDVEFWPYLGSALRVTRDNECVLLLRNQYGLLDLGLPSIQGAFGLPGSDELLVEWWGQLYLLSVEKRKLGLVVDGDEVVLRSPEFRITFDSDGE